VYGISLMVTAEESLTKYLADVLAQMSGEDNVLAHTQIAFVTRACIGMTRTWRQNLQSRWQ
jgi:hypothetical protein